MSTTDRSILERFDLKDRVAIVTGGSRGIGLEITKAFVDAGASVVVASRKLDNCAAVADELNARAGTKVALPVAAHAGSNEDLASLVQATVKAFGRIDIVVNNAANALAQPIGQITESAWDKAQATNLRGPLFLVQEALPFLRESPNPSVINMVSAGIFTHGTGMAIYLSAKAGLQMLTRTMASELAPIRVNAIAPGTVDTDMLRANGEDWVEAVAGACLLRRVAEPWEIATMALLLASDAGSYITGQTMVVDGGMTTA